MTSIQVTTAGQRKMGQGARAILMGGLCLALSACGFSLLGEAPPPNRLFDLQPVEGVQVPRATPDALLIGEFVAPRYLDTDRIAIRSPSNEIRYLAGVRWADRAPRLIQGQLVRSFDGGGIARLVARQGADVQGTYLLSGDLRAFEVIENRRAPRVHVDVLLTLVDAATLTPLASTTRTEETGITAIETAPILKGFDAAMLEITGAALTWAADTLAEKTAMADSTAR